MNYPIKINNITIMSEDVRSFLRKGQKNKAIDYIITKTGCNNNEAVEVIEDMMHMSKLQSTKNVSYETEIKPQIHEEHNIPKCPTCGSSNIEIISMTSKITNTMLFGIFGNKRKKQFHCNNCKYEW